jgi:hypothetical protein
LSFEILNCGIKRRELSLDIGLSGKVKVFPGINHVIESGVDIVENGSQLGLDNASDFGRV